MKKLVNILNKDCTCSAKFNFIEDEEEFDKSTSPDKYKVWNIVQDGSISCDIGLNSEDSDFMYYTTKGVKTSKKSNSVIKTCTNPDTHVGLAVHKRNSWACGPLQAQSAGLRPNFFDRKLRGVF